MTWCPLSHRQFHLKHQVIQHPGLVLKPQDWEIGLGDILQHGDATDLVHQDIYMEPGRHISWYPGPWLNSKVGVVQGGLGGHALRDQVGVVGVDQVKMRLREKDWSYKSTDGSVVNS